MRIHGKARIRRRSGLEERPYKDYEPELRADFQYLCGYCGKSEKITKKGFEIDHFTPQKIAPKLKNNYGNLVYSCFTCNRKKGSKWPTGNPQEANDGVIGFVDPATDEFDSHLKRDETGKIIACTSIGNYMASVFQFDRRPMDVIWKAMQIKDLKEQLRQKWNVLLTTEKDEYILLDDELESLLSYMFEKKE